MSTASEVVPLLDAIDCRVRMMADCLQRAMDQLEEMSGDDSSAVYVSRQTHLAADHCSSVQTYVKELHDLALRDWVSP